MPVTAKLSREFYDKFGDKIADELVNWFNQVDATYRSDLRELNELNFARFDAKLEQRLSELRTEIMQRFAESDAKWERRFAESDAKWERRLGGSDATWERRFAESDVKWERRFAESDVKWERRMGEIKVSLIRWMFGLWTVGTLTILGTTLAIVKL